MTFNFDCTEIVSTATFTNETMKVGNAYYSSLHLPRLHNSEEVLLINSPQSNTLNLACAVVGRHELYDLNFDNRLPVMKTTALLHIQLFHQ